MPNKGLAYKASILAISIYVEILNSKKYLEPGNAKHYMAALNPAVLRKSILDMRDRAVMCLVNDAGIVEKITI